MRFFIALDIPLASKEELEVVQQTLKETVPQIRLTDNNKLHLTIAFIGEQPDQLQKNLAEIIRQAVFDISPFQVTPAYIDGFPNLHSARVFWMGVKGDIDRLFIMRERIKDGLEFLGLSTDERRYIPHIAIAKTYPAFRLKPYQEIEIEKLESKKFKPIHTNSIKLFESIPQEGFHIHNTLAEIPLLSH